VHGEVAIDGVLEANQYVWQHMPIVPMQVAPGVAVLAVLQAVPQPGQKVPKPNAPKTQPQSQPSASGSKNGSSAASPSSPADEKSPSDE
jgi:hypothetical protein